MTQVAALENKSQAATTTTATMTTAAAAWPDRRQVEANRSAVSWHAPRLCCPGREREPQNHSPLIGPLGPSAQVETPVPRPWKRVRTPAATATEAATLASASA